MSSLVVVLDANVLFPASLRDTLLRAAEANLYQFRCTEEILVEVQRNLVNKRKINERQAQRLMNTIRLKPNCSQIDTRLNTRSGTLFTTSMIGRQNQGR